MKANKDKYEEWHKDPSNWKMGVFYYNKEDHRLLPPKRFKSMGWTVNFANTKSIIFFLIILFGIMAIGLAIANYDS